MTGDFLNASDFNDDEIDSIIGVKGDDPGQAKDQAAAAPPADNSPTSVEEETVSSSDTQDWVEPEKIDLPGQLPLDIYETKDLLVVICRVAGVEEENIDVSISANNILAIRGSLSAKTEDKVENHIIQECYWGEFSRSVSLPVDVKKDNINATLENGILKIIFIKIKQDAIKKIDINQTPISDHLLKKSRKIQTKHKSLFKI